MTEEVGNDNSDNATSNPKSVFSKLKPLTAQQRPSIFSKMGNNNTPKSSAFYRLKGDKQPKSSVLGRIKTMGKSSSSSPVQDSNSVFSFLGEVNEVQSSIPSRMKLIFSLGIKTDGSLKVKRFTLVIPSYEASSNSRKTKSKLLLTCHSSGG